MNLPEIELTVNYKGNVNKSDLVMITSSEMLYDTIKPLFDATIHWQEEMVMLCLNNMNKVIAFYRVSRGGTSGTMCDPKIIFSVALNCMASKIIIAHNHPSGNLKPSRADENMTEKIKKAGDVMDIPLLEHMIITDEGFYSFADNGLL